MTMMEVQLRIILRIIHQTDIRVVSILVEFERHIKEMGIPPSRSLERMQQWVDR
jgi:hypothetical protein